MELLRKPFGPSGKLLCACIENIHSSATKCVPRETEGMPTKYSHLKLELGFFLAAQRLCVVKFAGLKPDVVFRNVRFGDLALLQRNWK